jgi:hypothetical protein
MHNCIVRKICIGIFAAYLFTSLYSQEVILLSGRWGFKLDKLNVGITEKWYQKKLTDLVVLPGSLQESGFGNDISSQTQWIGGPIDNFYKNPKYKPYRRDDNFKFPFWLTPDKYYRGIAWYQREISIPAEWMGKPVILKLERCHWATRVYFDNKLIGVDSSLSTPHIYKIDPVYIPGRHTITIRVDNNYLIDVGENAHSVSDQTQGTWNGITGEISVSVKPEVYIKNVQIYPSVKDKKAIVHVFMRNTTGKTQRGDILLQAKPYNFHENRAFPVLRANYSSKDSDKVVVEYPMGDSIALWDEFNPALYSMEVTFQNNRREIPDKQNFVFGMREFKTNGTRFEINGREIFLRGTLECAIFPKTGYPPTDTAQWSRIFRIIKQYGLNHIRFHSWCPPKAAFDAADKEGIYLQIEVCAWAKLGSGGSVDTFLYKESNRIAEEYGNHPSFCMMVPSNEPGGGDKMVRYVTDFVKYWKHKDSRRVYSAGSGWPFISESDYHITPEPRIQHWGEGLKSIINSQPPNTTFNYNNVIAKFNVPLVSHEVGQWCAYPNFNEMGKYTGIMKPRNFEIFRDFLKENHLENKVDRFVMASGNLQVLCYKQEIEAALRTTGLAGFQLLDLHDFPGQGTALVGVLDPFWDNKPYITYEKYRRFCNTTVPLASMEKFVWKNSERFQANILVTHFGRNALENAEIIWRIRKDDNTTLSQGSIRTSLSIGTNIITENIIQSLSDVKEASRLNLEISVNGLFYNDWDFWVYPVAFPNYNSHNIIVTDTLTTDISAKLYNGSTVLLFLHNKIKKEKGKEIKLGFSTVFWNTEYTNNQAPHTLGILCDPKNALFRHFPTDYYTNMQWWDIISNAQVMVLNDFNPNMVPSIQIIDTWFEARKLGILFEAKVGKGKIIVTSIDFKNNMEGRIASRQLYYSILKYMESNDFNPSIQAELGLIKGLYE